MRNLDKATEAWGGEPPEWIGQLAQRCDASNQGAVALEMGYSNAVINQVLRKRYAGNLDKVRQAFEGVVFDLHVRCPVLGEIPRAQCQKHQRQRFNPANHQLVRLYRACRGDCAHANRED